MTVTVHIVWSEVDSQDAVLRTCAERASSIKTSLSHEYQATLRTFKTFTCTSFQPAGHQNYRNRLPLHFNIELIAQATFQTTLSVVHSNRLFVNTTL